MALLSAGQACASLVGTLLVAALAATATRLVTGLPAATVRLVAEDMLILGPLITFQAVGAVIAAASQAAGRYWVPAAAAVCQQGVTTLLVATGLPVTNRVLLPLAFTLGAFSYLLFLVGAWPWRRARIQPSLSVPAGLIASARLAVPLASGTVALQLGLVGLRVFAARLAPGTVTAFDLAYRVSIALVEVSASGVLAVALTQWSAAVVAGNTDSLRSRLRDTLTLVLFVIFPLVVTLHALRRPLVSLWLSSHASGAAIIGMTIAALGILLIGVPLDIAGRLYVRVLVARERTGVLGWLSVQRMVITLILAALLVTPLGLRGLALSDTLAIAVTLLGLHGQRRELGMGAGAGVEEQSSASCNCRDYCLDCRDACWLQLKASLSVAPMRARRRRGAERLPRCGPDHENARARDGGEVVQERADPSSSTPACLWQLSGVSGSPAKPWRRVDPRPGFGRSGTGIPNTPLFSRSIAQTSLGTRCSMKWASMSKCPAHSLISVRAWLRNRTSPGAWHQRLCSRQFAEIRGIPSCSIRLSPISPRRGRERRTYPAGRWRCGCRTPDRNDRACRGRRWPVLLEEVRRVLRPGGHVIMTTPHREDMGKNEVLCPNCRCVFHRMQHLRSFRSPRPQGHG